MARTRCGASSPTAPINGTTVTPAGNLDKIPLRSGSINTATDTEPDVSADLREAAGGAKQLRIVQFAGPILPAWIDGLKALGLRTVSYLPPNAYVVFGDAGAVSALSAQAASDAAITYEGSFRPAYRLAPDLEQARTSGSGDVDVVVQVVEGEGGDIAAAKAMGTALAGDNSVAGFTNLELRVPAAALTDLAKLPAVVNVERRVVPVRMDEAQGQIVAGNIQTSSGKKVPTGPGYLAFLTAHGVPTGSALHPRVAVVDDGVDNGTTNPLHKDFRVLGVPANASRIQANVDCTGGGNPRAIAGHGNINAGIIGGYNNGTGAANQDANGFNYGLGIDPFARLSNIKIFTDAGALQHGGVRWWDIPGHRRASRESRRVDHVELVGSQRRRGLHGRVAGVRRLHPRRIDGRRRAAAVPRLLRWQCGFRRQHDRRSGNGEERPDRRCDGERP